MPKAIYLNLIVEDLKRAKVFFEALGFSFNKQFTNDEAAAMVISETINVMLHTQESIKRFTRKELVDSKTQTEALIALQLDSKQEVDALIEKAIKAGANEYREADKYDFMYARTFEDLDGHIWEAFWMSR
jgi:predicted lactoylglutathione lyase